MPHVILINPFEVPEGKDEEFFAAWEAAKACMGRQLFLRISLQATR